MISPASYELSLNESYFSLWFPEYSIEQTYFLLTFRLRMRGMHDFLHCDGEMGYSTYFGDCAFPY